MRHENPEVNAACEALRQMGFECMDTISAGRLAEHWSAVPPSSVVLQDYPDAQRRHIHTYIAKVLTEAQLAQFAELTGWERGSS